MTALKCLTAATAMLAVSISAAAACDDYEEEMALAEAVQASKVAESAAPQPAPGAQATSPASGPTSVAAAETNLPADASTGTVRQ
jgi:hypothetical protein